MNREQARQILLLHRPGLDEADAEVTAALALVQQDEELRRWFEAQQAAQAAIRQQLRRVKPPAGLKEQILSERPWYLRPVTAGHLVGVAAVLVAVSLLGFWWTQRAPVEDTSFAAYRARMVGTAQRAYGMELETNDLAHTRAFLQERGAPGDFVAPTNLAKAIELGCLAVPWQAHQVAMVCFKTSRPLPPGQASDLWFFVIENACLQDAPKSASPEFATVNAVSTASWTRAGKTYVLAVEGDTDLLRKYL